MEWTAAHFGLFVGGLAAGFLLGVLLMVAIFVRLEPLGHHDDETVGLDA